MEFTILMPCLDEALTIETCIRKARGYLDAKGIDGEILVADNGSTDGSDVRAVAAGARVVRIAR
jgi:glycosyltransferase involved in cell wall biosynthesis